MAEIHQNISGINATGGARAFARIVYNNNITIINQEQVPGEGMLNQNDGNHPPKPTDSLLNSEGERKQGNASPVANTKSDSGSHISATKDPDLSSHNPESGSSSRKRGPRDLFSSLKLLIEARKKQKRLREEGIEGTKIQISQMIEETRGIKALYTKDIELRRLEKKEKDAERKHELAMKKMDLKSQLLDKKTSNL
ncbi:hypothetical protein MMC31_006112 [Peltigera leucophlebia]|nr:hypothetical protein [Peltigera leucophlebia]